MVPEKVAMLNRKASPIADTETEDYLQHALNLRATLDEREAYEGTEFVIIVTPTDYEPQTNTFNTKSVEAMVRDVLAKAVMVIRSTVPMGYTAKLKANFGCDKGIPVIVYEPVLSVPEFFLSRVVNDLAAFKCEVEVIIANRTPTTSATWLRQSTAETSLGKIDFLCIHESR